MARAMDFMGTWRLVSWILDDGAGTRHEPMGPNPIGLLTYTSDGYMFGTLMAPGREKFAGNDPLGGSEAECHKAMSTCHSYCGRYRLDGDSVVHSVELAVYPNMVGSEQRRFFRFEGELLKLRTPPMTRKGQSGIAELTWRRA
ncbi:MAG: lipocalin-like domain-containing protein [Proteobacteria bacterium]|nr:lipocalin-like domain-containing protein [Pseudomonadota bacterium]MBI3499418.1 lipocalin-like domain-containing protein [Pseudomonadota bacterium]